MRNTEAAALLQVDGLDVYYGQAHVLQSVSLRLDQGVLAVVGRNGMGKTTLCRALTGMVPGRGSVQLGGVPLLGRRPDVITRLGVAYVPQGRRVWRSLTVDETLRLAARTARQGAWTVERVYQAFPRLAERRGNGGAQLSGGEQQMLAIGRALLFNPRLLVMDEPTEGLAPVIVEQVASLLKALADERSIALLLIEQNLGVALELADRVAIMVNGRIAHELPAAALAADRALQQRLLGLKAGSGEDAAAPPSPEPGPAGDAPRPPVLRVVRAHGHDTPPRPAEAAPAPTPLPARPTTAATPDLPAVYLAGPRAALQPVLAHAQRCLEQLGARVVTLDLAGTDAAVLAAHLGSRTDLGALLLLTHADTAALACSVVGGLPAGVPKVLVSDRPLPGTEADALVMTVPLGGLHRVSATLLGQAAAATVGMLRPRAALPRGSRPLVAITSLGLAGTAVRQLCRALGDGIDTLVLDMAADGAARLTRLAGSGLLDGVIDLAPVDVSRAVVLGPDGPARARLQALAASGLPCLLVPTLLEVMCFASGHAVPATLLQREVLASAHDGALVPVSAAEAERIGDWLARQLGAFPGPLRLVLPPPSSTLLHGLGGAAWPGLPPASQPGLQAGLHRALRRALPATAQHQVLDVPHALDDPRLGDALAQALRPLLAPRAAA